MALPHLWLSWRPIMHMPKKCVCTADMTEVGILEKEYHRLDSSMKLVCEMWCWGIDKFSFNTSLSWECIYNAPVDLDHDCIPLWINHKMNFWDQLNLRTMLHCSPCRGETKDIKNALWVGWAVHKDYDVDFSCEKQKNLQWQLSPFTEVYTFTVLFEVPRYAFLFPNMGGKVVTL